MRYDYKTENTCSQSCGDQLAKAVRAAYEAQQESGQS